MSLYLLGQPHSSEYSVARAGPFVNRMSSFVLSRLSDVTTSTLPALLTDLHNQLSLLITGPDGRHSFSKPGAFNSI